MNSFFLSFLFLFFSFFFTYILNIWGSMLWEYGSYLNFLFPTWPPLTLEEGRSVVKVLDLHKTFSDTTLMGRERSASLLSGREWKSRSLRSLQWHCGRGFSLILGSVADPGSPQELLWHYPCREEEGNLIIARKVFADSVGKKRRATVSPMVFD